METVNLINFSNIFETTVPIIPKDLVTIIYDYYKTYCEKCYSSQELCSICNTYQCFCSKKIIHCNILECGKLLCCEKGFSICPSTCVYSDCGLLCEYCYHLDLL